MTLGKSAHVRRFLMEPENKLALIKVLSDAANGALAGEGKIMLET